jgi:protein gp37
MSKGLISSRIPWLVGGYRFDPITGCNNSPQVCAVRDAGLCWAENMSEDFTPQFHEDRLDVLSRTRKPKVIAVGLGGDMWCDGVKQEWREKVFDEVCCWNDHTYIFLTKRPENIGEEITDCTNHCWYGVSVCEEKDGSREHQLFHNLPYRAHKWVSFEPVLELITHPTGYMVDYNIEFAVIGGLSDGAGRIVREDEGGTRPEWVQPILDACHEANVPRFLKNFTKSQLSRLTDPRTGKPFESLAQGRDVPPWFAK